MFTRGESHEKSPVSVKDTQVQLFYACGRFGLYKEMTGPPWSRWVSVIFQYYFFWWCVVPETISKLFETSRVADSSSCVSSLTLGLLYFLLMLLDIRTPYIVWLVVSTPLKNISRLGLLFPIYGKIKKCSKPPTSLMSKRHNVLQQIISKRWNTHKSNQMLNT